MTDHVNPADPGSIPKFVAPLPIPAVLQPIGIVGTRPLHEVTMDQVSHRFTRNSPDHRLGR